MSHCKHKPLMTCYERNLSCRSVPFQPTLRPASSPTTEGTFCRLLCVIVLLKCLSNFCRYGQASQTGTSAATTYGKKLLSLCREALQGIETGTEWLTHVRFIGGMEAHCQKFLVARTKDACKVSFLSLWYIACPPEILWVRVPLSVMTGNFSNCFQQTLNPIHPIGNS